MLSDRERRVLDEIERGLSSDDSTGSHPRGPAPPNTRMVVPDTGAYAVLAVLSSVFAMLLLARWPGLAAMMLLMAVANWKIAFGAGSRRRRRERRGAGGPK